MLYGDTDLGQHCPECTKPLAEKMLTYHQWNSVALTQDQFHRKYLKYQFVKWVWKTHTHSYFSPAVYELIQWCFPHIIIMSLQKAALTQIHFHDWWRTINALSNFPEYLINNTSRLDQVIAWFYQLQQKTANCLSQCRVRPALLHVYGITRPQWVKYNMFVWTPWHNLWASPECVLHRQCATTLETPFTNMV